MGNDGLKVLISAAQLISLALRIFTIMQYWAWFAVGDLGLPMITIIHAYLIMFISGILNGFELPFPDTAVKRTSEERWALAGGKAVAYIAGCIFALAVGLIATGL